LSHDKSIINSNLTALTSSKLVNKSNSTPIILSTTKNSNYTISPTTSLSSVQSTSSPLKLIIKASGPSSTLNGLASISSSYNHNDEDDDEDDDDDEDNHDLSELQQPAKKKQRTKESQISPSVSSLPPVHTSVLIPTSFSSQAKSMDEQSITSASSSMKDKKKKKKKKSHKHRHHHHHKSHHHHHKRSRRDSSRSRSRSPISSSSSSLIADDQYRRHRKSKKHRRYKRCSSSSASPSSREPL
jgi:hypothetical protein